LGAHRVRGQWKMHASLCLPYIIGRFFSHGNKVRDSFRNDFDHGDPGIETIISCIDRCAAGLIFPVGSKRTGKIIFPVLIQEIRNYSFTCSRSFIFYSILPIIRFSMKICNCDYQNFVFPHLIYNAIRETPGLTPSSTS
jgi:hypothetical protein